MSAYKYIENGLFALCLISIVATLSAGCTHNRKKSSDTSETPLLDKLAEDMVYVEKGGESFYICKYEVTQKLWSGIMKDNPSQMQGDDLPVEQISWNDCQVFLSKLNELTGKNYRLPTEAEWEYACRGGKYSKGYKYSGSNDIDKVAWFDENSELEVVRKIEQPGCLVHIKVTDPA